MDAPTELLVLTKFPRKGGRQAKYHTPAEKSQAQRHNAIVHYIRKRALQKRIKEIEETEGPDGIKNGGQFPTVEYLQNPLFHIILMFIFVNQFNL